MRRAQPGKLREVPMRELVVGDIVQLYGRRHDPG
jgi:magnesium-transporting ATPase (P-type)